MKYLGSGSKIFLTDRLPVILEEGSPFFFVSDSTPSEIAFVLFQTSVFSFS